MFKNSFFCSEWSSHSHTDQLKIPEHPITFSDHSNPRQKHFYSKYSNQCNEARWKELTQHISWPHGNKLVTPEKTLGQLWDNFEPTLGQLWDNFGTVLRKLRGNYWTLNYSIMIYMILLHQEINCPGLHWQITLSHLIYWALWPT